MTSLPDFLLARIAEDEEGARIHPREWWSSRLEAECEAKRQIVDRMRHIDAGVLLVGNTPDALREYRSGVLFAVRVLATVYADHPDYDEAWRP